MLKTRITRPIRWSALLLVVLANAACAANAAVKEVPLEQRAAAVSELVAYTWYDGGKPRTAWLQPRQVADFSGDIKAAMPEARQLSARGGAVVYELAAGQDSKAAVAAATASDAKAAVSPVFYDDGQGQGRKRALPGNVVVQFADDVRPATVEAWAEREQLTLLHKLNFGNYYLVRSPAGLASLELANRLQEQELVLSAQPNWWVEAVTR